MVAAVVVTAMLSSASPELAADAYTYFESGEKPYVQPNFELDYDWLHVELRHNYEALGAVSLWMGTGLHGGKKLTWSIIFMIGGVFGEDSGIAPGFELELGWWRFDLFSQSEFVVFQNREENSFFYNWSELGFSPVDPLRIGAALQRTFVHHRRRDLEPGVFAGLRGFGLDFTAYVFDLQQPTVVLAIGVGR